MATRKPAAPADAPKFTVHLTPEAAGGRRAVGEYLPGRDYSVDAFTALRLTRRGFRCETPRADLVAAAEAEVARLASGAEDGSDAAREAAARAAAELQILKEG